MASRIPVGTFYRTACRLRFWSESDWSDRHGEPHDTKLTQRRITIDPVTRLEGHGKIEIFLNEEGTVERAYFQVPELRGFEKFAQGRPAEDMPQITSRICGVCPTAHHMASTKALDALYQVTPPPAARKIRELVYSTFMVEDHALHFYFLGGPDFVVGPKAPAAERNVLGVIAKVGTETAMKVIAMRRKLRDLIALAAGKAIHPVFGVPGGVSPSPSPREDAVQFRTVAAEAVEFAQIHARPFREGGAWQQRVRGPDPLRCCSPTAPITWAWWTSRTTSTSMTACCASWRRTGMSGRSSARRNTRPTSTNMPSHGPT